MISLLSNYIGGKLAAYLTLAGVAVAAISGIFAYQKYDEWRDERRGLRSGNDYYRKVIRDPQQRIYDAEKNIISRENDNDSHIMLGEHNKVDRKLGLK